MQDSFLARLTHVVGATRLRPEQTASSRPRPERPICVIGDIHGDAARLDELLHRLAGDFGPDRAPPHQTLVFVGDYIDRGEDSRSVLERLYRLSSASPSTVVCLMGNHERMMLDFLSDPVQAGRRWLAHGGLQTLASFGIRGMAETSDGATRRAAAGQLRRLMEDRTPGLHDWLRARPKLFRSGNVAVTHAGGAPRIPLELQTERDAIWGNAAFGKTPRADGLWMVCGHWTHAQPLTVGAAIQIDTGAGQGGELTAVLLDPAGTIRFQGTGASWLSFDPVARGEAPAVIAGVALPALPA